MHCLKTLTMLENLGLWVFDMLNLSDSLGRLWYGVGDMGLRRELIGVSSSQDIDVENPQQRGPS